LVAAAEVNEMAKSKTSARGKKRSVKVVYRLGKAGNIDPKAIRAAIIAVKKEREQEAKMAKVKE
jgi:hypothetical protein